MKIVENYVNAVKSAVPFCASLKIDTNILAFAFLVFSSLLWFQNAQAATIVTTDGGIDASGELSLTFNSVGAYNRKQIFIDSDINASTGFDAGYDVLVEDGYLYTYSGTGGSNWSWSAAGTATGPIGNGYDSIHWLFPESAVGGVLVGAPLLFSLQDTAGTTDQTSVLTALQTTFLPLNDTSLFANPERGIYFYTKIEADTNGNYVWSGADAATLRAEGKTLVLLIVDMRNEVNSADLPASLLSELETTLQYLESNGIKAVFRGRYKEEAGGCPADPANEPASVSTITDHIEDLAGVINNYPGAIAYIEAGMIGRWGEWNCSIHDINDPQLALDIVGTWLAEVPDRFVGLRRPRFKADAPFTHAQAARVSHYNDCFLYNAGHRGTYDPGVSMSTVQEYRDYLQGTSSIAGETDSVPMGGESCGIAPEYPGSADTYAPVPGQNNDDCAKGQLAFNDYRYSYLSGWETAWPLNWISEGCWGQIQRNLGYRFDIERVEFSGEVFPGATVAMEIEIQNDGYARLYRDRDVELIFSTGGTIVEQLLLNAVSPSAWKPGNTVDNVNIVIPAALAPGNYEVGLRLSDPYLPTNPLHAIRFANDDWDEVSGVQYFGTLNLSAVNSALCNGKQVTVDLSMGQLTTPGDDVILGTDGPDDIRGKGGNDTICGLGGDDYIHGNSGDDWIDGGDGIDNLRGGRGSDTIYTGNGGTVGTSSRVFGGYDDDTIFGSAEADDLRGGKGADTIYGGDGDDQIAGNDGDDILYGERGDDALKGGVGENDELYGGFGWDSFNGGSGDNDLCDTGGDVGEVQINCEP